MARGGRQLSLWSNVADGLTGSGELSFTDEALDQPVIEPPAGHLRDDCDLVRADVNHGRVDRLSSSSSVRHRPRWRWLSDQRSPPTAAWRRPHRRTWPSRSPSTAHMGRPVRVIT